MLYQLRLRHSVLFSLAAFATASAGCDVKSTPTPSPSKVEWVDPSKIQSGPTLHDSLPPELVERIKRVHSTFADVEGTPIEKWMDDFKRDLDPEGDVQTWEDMVVAYDKYIDGRELPLDTRKEVFKVVLFRSMASESDVLSRIELKRLTQDDARKIMAGYPAPPKPIDVIQSR